MLELKSYQQKSLDVLKEFLSNASTLKGERGIRLAYLDQLGDDARAYKPIDGLESCPYVCIKIPTGGGKTLVAAESLKVIQDNYLQDKNGVGLVMWYVPSDAIRTQTLENLRNRNHPYREQLDLEFNNCVKVFSIEEALSIQKTDLENNLCIVVSSLAAFRRSDKTWLKVFQNNGALLNHFEALVEESDFLQKDEDNSIICSLANVIRINTPIVVLDEGHNAQTSLSFDMLRELNPSTIVEFTATPRSESNVLIQVLASDLKAEKMVKIPIYLSNVAQWQEAIRDGVAERDNLQKLADQEKRKTKEYIRPIALLQAEQEKESPNKINVEKIKAFLVDELKIPEEEIAIKTSKQDEIRGVDLLSPKCPIKYIITVNALKEGWDCPFAYILISVANIGSTIAVEQTLGRILRLPKAQLKESPELNSSFVFTSSESFSKASSAVIKGLENNGYSRDDLKENNGHIVPEKTENGRAYSGEVKIPIVGLKSTGEALAFNRDLLGENFKVFEHIPKIDIDFHADQNRKVKIDVDNENHFIKVQQGKLQLILHPEDFSEDELISWLKRNLRHSAIAAAEMAIFIDQAIKQLVPLHGIEELSINRFRLKEELQIIIAQIISNFAETSFKRLDKSGDITSDTAFYVAPLNISMRRTSEEHFIKHLYEKSGAMNGEETEFAFRLDGLENIEWWFRSREKEDLSLQGWRQGKFYADFIVKTNSGSYILVEYKGEDRISNDDTKYKVELGEYWQSLTDNTHKFYLATKKNNESIIKEISAL